MTTTSTTIHDSTTCNLVNGQPCVLCDWANEVSRRPLIKPITLGWIDARCDDTFHAFQRRDGKIIVIHGDGAECDTAEFWIDSD
jgi:hypothetical protein